MPNWVYNGLTIEGNESSINKLVAQMNKPYSRIHDQWNSETNKIEKKRVLYSNPVFSFWNIIKPTDLEAYENQPNHSLPISEQIKFEGNDWYSWNNRHWGVKWDVSVSNEDSNPDTYIEGPVQNGENYVVYYNFNTAWSIPDEALAELSAQYPDLLFTLSYEEETGWGGEHEYLRGERLDGTEWNWKCMECDYMEPNDPDVNFCDECGDYICPTCGNGTGEEGCAEHKVEANA